MDIYDIDYSQQAPELLPPDKRDRPRISLIASLLTGVQWCRDLIMGSYKNGSTDPNYSPGTYPIYAKVIYNKSVYYSLVNNNTDLPTVTSSWLKIQDNFLGSSERVKFNGQNIVLEYALNQRFNGTFRPPPSITPSDIYMQILPSVVAGFNVGKSIGSTVGRTTSTDKIGLSSPFVKVNNFKVNVTAAIFATTNEQEIRDFINLYIPASIKFTITTY